jgi:LmbE family N-acetylglucosaminyl deacetylase
MTTDWVPSDEPLPDSIVADVLACRDWPASAVLYVPLAIGAHIDHRIVHRAGRSLARSGRTVLFFEDLPYARSRGVPPELRLPEWAPVVREVEAEDLAAKARAIACYRSQLPALFLSLTGEALPMAAEDSMIIDRLYAAVATYAASVADGTCRYAERLWQLQPGSV